MLLSFSFLCFWFFSFNFCVSVLSFCFLVFWGFQFRSFLGSEFWISWDFYLLSAFSSVLVESHWFSLISAESVAFCIDFEPKSAKNHHLGR